MKMKNSLVFVVLLMLAVGCMNNPEKQVANVTTGTDSTLASWQPETRGRILKWIREATDSTSANFIPEADRIAVFDNDGTLWPEQPVPNQLAFAVDLLKVLSGQHPEWQKDADLKAYLNNDMAGIQKSGKKGLLKVMGLSHSNMTETVFNDHVQNWVDTAKDKKFGRRYLDLVYQPMLELLEELRKNGFKTFIVSGGGADFMRVWTEKVYGIPPYQVIGSYMGAKFELKDSIPVITKVSEDVFFDDKAEKPVAIHRFIGKVPVFCGGNSDGDLAMMQYTATSKYKTMNVLMHHTDSVREYRYALKTISGHLEQALVEAKAKNWVVVDMEKDLKRIFPFQK